jgi:hypothetical protein
MSYMKIDLPHIHDVAFISSSIVKKNPRRSLLLLVLEPEDAVVRSHPVVRLRLHGHQMAQEDAHGHGPESDRIRWEPQLESVRCSGTRGLGRRIWAAEESKVVLK